MSSANLQTKEYKKFYNLEEKFFYFFLIIYSFCFSFGSFSWTDAIRWLFGFRLPDEYFYLVAIPPFSFIALFALWGSRLKRDYLNTIFLIAITNFIGNSTPIFVFYIMGNVGMPYRFFVVSIALLFLIVLVYTIFFLFGNFIKDKFKLFCSLLFFFLSIPFIVGAPISLGSVYSSIVNKTIKQRQEAPKKYSISDEVVADYWRIAQDELKSKYRFKTYDFYKMFSDISECALWKCDKYSYITFSKNRWGGAFYFENSSPVRLKKSTLSYNNSGMLLPVKNGLCEFVCLRIESDKISADVYVSEDNRGYHRRLRIYNLTGEDALKKAKSCQEYEAYFREKYHKPKPPFVR